LSEMQYAASRNGHSSAAPVWSIGPLQCGQEGYGGQGW
jgi:hypothetical protein